MKCLICRQAEIVDGLTSITFERDEFRLVINNVPAQICPACGEAIMNEDVANRLLNKAEEAALEGILEDIRNYEG